MAITLHASGTRTAGAPPEGSATVLGTASDTTQGIFQFFVDCTAMARNDQVAITVFEKCISGGSQVLVFSTLLANAQDEPLWVSPSIILLYGWDIRLQQLAGSARSFPWSIRKVA